MIYFFNNQVTKMFSIQVFKLTLFAVYLDSGTFWFKLFGKGLLFKNVIKRGMMFSEREGHTKHIRIGKYLIKFIK